MLGPKRSLVDIAPLEEDLLEIGLSDLLNEEASDELTEAKFKKTKTQRSTSSQRLKWARQKRRPSAKAKAKKRLRKPLVKRRSKMLQKFKKHRNIHKRPPGRGGRIIYRMNQGMDRVSNLVEEVAELVGSLDEASQTEIIKAYANSAVVAEMLGERFLLMAHAIAEEAGSDDDRQIAEELANMSEQLDAVAEDAAESAEVLFALAQEGTLAESVDHDAVEENFRDVMSAVLEGLEIYSDLTEEEELDEMKGQHGKADFTSGKRGELGPDSTKQMDVPKMGKFPPIGRSVPKVNQT